jgi:tRNA threonylcarbamoyladenosine biosynthesis protein TsaB
MKPILALETSTSRCGVALISHHNGVQTVVVRELQGVSGHAESLLPLVQEVLDATETARDQLGAIAFGQGPGAFTGLRVACGAAQGIGFALGIPVLPVGALTAMAAAMSAQYGLRLVALDARMHEVYFAVWAQTSATEASQIYPETLGLMPLQAPVLIAAQDLMPFILQRLPYWLMALEVSTDAGSAQLGSATMGSVQIGLSGNGWALLGETDQWFEVFKARCKTVLRPPHTFNLCDETAIPQVAWVARLGAAALQAGKGLKAEQAAPFYLRDKVAFTSVERAQGMGGNPKAGDINGVVNTNVNLKMATSVMAPILLPMLRADLNEVAELEQMSQSFPWSKQNFADALAAGYPAWVVRNQGELAGFCVAMMAPDEMHVLVIAVNPNNRRHGLGSIMLQAARQLAVQSALSRILLEVRPSNEKALAFYNRNGFERIGVRKGYYPSGKTGREDALVLAGAAEYVSTAGVLL